MRDPTVRVAPLSPGQRRLWFIDQFAPDSPVYNEPLLAVRIRGPLEARALERSINIVVERHDILRTVIRASPEGPRQEILGSAPVRVECVDLEKYGEEAQSRMWTLAREEARRTFDLANGPLIRVTLLRVASQHHLLLVAMHHVVSDGWSLRVLLSELMVLYHSELIGAPAPLAPLRVQYSDYAEWMDRELARSRGDRLTQFWKSRLLPGYPRTSLPYDYTRPAIQRYVGRAERAMLSNPCVCSLNRVARRAGSTLFVVLLAAFLTVIHAMGGSTAMSVGTPVANRTRSEWEPLIGFFVNVIVLRVDLSGNPTFAELLERVRTVVLDAFDHQELPFDTVVELVAPEREANRQPLFDVMVAHHNFPVRRYRMNELEFERLDLEENDAKYDLVLLTVEVEDGCIDAQLIYDVDLFSATTIRTMLDLLHRLLESLEDCVADRLSRLVRRHVEVEDENSREEDYFERLLLSAARGE